MQIESADGCACLAADRAFRGVICRRLKKRVTWCGVLVDFKSQIKYSLASFLRGQWYRKAHHTLPTPIAIPMSSSWNAMKMFCG